jgi:hypothetical protein
MTWRSGPDIDRILARFPGPVTLNASRRKWSAILLFSALFAVGGIWELLDGDAKGWFVFAVFGSSAIVAATAMLPGANALTLKGDCFETTSLFRGNRVRWNDVSGFTVISFASKLVGYDHAGMDTRRLAKANTALFGRNAGLPDTYGLSHEQLASLMTRWRDRALPNETE